MGTTRITITWLATLILSTTITLATAHAGIYKWTDEQGNVHYGERPDAQAQGTERMSIRPRQPVAAATGEIEAVTTQEAQPAEGQPQEQQQQEQQRLPDKLVDAPMSSKEKRERCKQAKQHLATIQGKGRIREVDDRGNTRFMSAQEIQAKLKAANKNIRLYCR